MEGEGNAAQSDPPDAVGKWQTFRSAGNRAGGTVDAGEGDAGAAAAQQEHAQCAFTSDNSDTLHSQHALTPGGADTVENILLDERSSKAAKLQYLLENLVSRAVQESNEMVLKELDYRFRQMEENAQEREQKRMEREEEHYRKLDELLCQKGRRKGRRRR